MGCLYSLSLLACLLVTFVVQICGSEIKNENIRWFVEGNKTSERLYEAELENIIRSILKSGIPVFNIPPLDPLVFEDNIFINESDVSGKMTIKYLELGDFVVNGLSTFEVHSLHFDLLGPTINLNFTFPIEVKANHSNFSIIVVDLLPFNGEGPANLIAALRLEADIRFATLGSVLQIAALSADIFFDKLEVEFSTMMGFTGGKEAHILNKLMGDVTVELIDLVKPSMINGILESLLISANEFLLSANFTVLDLMNCLMGSDGCPFTLP